MQIKVTNQDYKISINKDALIDNFLIHAYAMEHYFSIDMLDELDSIAKKVEQSDNVNRRNDNENR
jgi:hypothetical protein